MPSHRLACIFVPLFPLAARLRSEPDLRGEATVVVEGNGNAARVIAASRKARLSGIEAGMTLPAGAGAAAAAGRPRARSARASAPRRNRCSKSPTDFRRASKTPERASMFLDLDGIPALGPRAADDDPDGARLERRFAGDLIAAVEKTGLPARVGIASSKLAARVAAGLPDSPRVVPPEQEAAFLAPLPLARLGPGDRDRRDPRAVGPALDRRLREAPAGRGREPPRAGSGGSCTPRRADSIRARSSRACPRSALSEGMDLEWPLVALEPFLFVGHAALERLTAAARRRRGSPAAASS